MFTSCIIVHFILSLIIIIVIIIIIIIIVIITIIIIVIITVIIIIIIIIIIRLTSAILSFCYLLKAHTRHLFLTLLKENYVELKMHLQYVQWLLIISWRMAHLASLA